MEKDHRPAYGYLLEADGGRLYVSGDLNAEKIDYPDLLNQDPVDLFVVEYAHFPAEKLIEKLQHCAAKRAAVVHTFPLKKYDVLKAARDCLPCELLLPEDGDSAEI